MRKYLTIFGIIMFLAVAIATPNQAQAGDRYHRGGGDGAAVAALIAGVAIGAMLASKSRKRHRYPPAYHPGDYRPSPYALQYNPYTANRRYLDSRHRRQCHMVYGFKNFGGISHVVERRVCR
jgi:hypothetical protein